MGLIVSILTPAGQAGNPSSNGGLSARCRQATLVGEGVDGPFEPTADRPAVKLVHRVLRDEHVIHAEPVDDPDHETTIGPMMGGAFIYSSDSRFGDAVGFYGAVPLHDRFETPQQYEGLSR